jgi:YVTN family beta-propeller protein
MTIDDRLRTATTALDRSVHEVDVLQRLGQLHGSQRRQARLAVALAMILLLAILGVLTVGLAIARRPHQQVIRPTPRPLGRVVAAVHVVAPVTPWAAGLASGAGAVWTLIETDSNGGKAVRVDPRTDRVVATIPVGEGPTEAVHGAGALWVTNSQDNTVTRIDPTSNKAVATIPVGAGPNSIGYAAGAVWVANSQDTTVTRIDPTRNKVVATIPVGAIPLDFRGLAASPDAVWAANGDNTVSRIDPTTNKVVATIAVPNCCDGGIAIGLGSVWLSNALNGTVIRIDPATNRVITTINVGAPTPSGIGIADGAVWTVLGGTGIVARIDPASNTIVHRVAVFQGAHSLTVEAGAVWVEGDANTITRIDPTQ